MRLNYGIAQIQSPKWEADIAVAKFHWRERILLCASARLSCGIEQTGLLALLQ
jgi:hypothetical protein